MPSASPCRWRRTNENYLPGTDGGKSPAPRPRVVGTSRVCCSCSAQCCIALHDFCLIPLLTHAANLGTQLSYLLSRKVLLDNGICSALDPCTITTIACHSLKSFPVLKEA